jgi:hypothetical protein
MIVHLSSARSHWYHSSFVRSLSILYQVNFLSSISTGSDLALHSHPGTYDHGVTPASLKCPLSMEPTWHLTVPDSFVELVQDEQDPFLFWHLSPFYRIHRLLNLVTRIAQTLLILPISANPALVRIGVKQGALLLEPGLCLTELRDEDLKIRAMPGQHPQHRPLEEVCGCVLIQEVDVWIVFWCAVEIMREAPHVHVDHKALEICNHQEKPGCAAKVPHGLPTPLDADVDVEVPEQMKFAHGVHHLKEAMRTILVSVVRVMDFKSVLAKEKARHTIAKLRIHQAGDAKDHACVAKIPIT